MTATAEPPILLVEDDPELRDLVGALLRREGWAVETAADGAGFDAARARIEPRLVILDVMLPGEDGFSICRRLRAESDLPILMLTAKGDAIDRIVGLEIGADDYLPKPFEPRELVARIRALLRRSAAAMQAPASAERLTVGPWTVDLGARSLIGPDGADPALTSAEFDLLAALIEAPGRVLDRDHLLDRVFGRQAAVYDRSIDVLVSRLRKKIEPDPETPSLVKTVRGAGYVLSAPIARAAR